MIYFLISPFHAIFNFIVVTLLQAQEIASERAQRTLQDSERLIKELELIRQNGEKEIRREHPEQFDVRSSLSRCEDLEKRLAGIRSPISIAINEIESQILDGGLTDAGLRDRLQSAGDRLKSSRDAADGTVQGRGQQSWIPGSQTP